MSVFRAREKVDLSEVTDLLFRNRISESGQMALEMALGQATTMLSRMSTSVRGRFSLDAVCTISTGNLSSGFGTDELSAPEKPLRTCVLEPWSTISRMNQVSLFDPRGVGLALG